jgi:hypothetical protein
MVEGVRSVLRSHWDTFVHLDLKRKLKVAARFVHLNADGMKRLFAKAEARNEARRAVYEAVTRLNDKGRYKTRNLDSFRSILEEVRAGGPEGKLLDPDFCVAVNDEAWKASVAKAKKPAVFLKARERAPRDGTKDLGKDLHKKAKGGWMGYATAVNLTALLDKFKNRELTGMERREFLEGYSDTLKELALCLPIDFYNTIKTTDSPAEVANAFMSAYRKHRSKIENYMDTVSDFIGKTATKFIHPRLETVLEAARQCPTKNNNQFSLDHEYIVKLFQHHFDLFSGPEVWSHKEVRRSLYEYYGVALSIAALEKLSQKASFSQDDVALLKGTLKHVTPAEHKDPKIREQLAEKIAARQKKSSDAFAKIDLEGDPGNVLFEMSKVVADHYMKVLNFYDYSKRPAVVRAIETAHDVNDVIQALKNAFAQAIQMKVDREMFFQPLEDLAAGSP